MTIKFDEKTKELARAHDAVDRLRDVAQQLRDAQTRTGARRDIAIRAALLVFVWLTLLFGIHML